MTTNMQVTPGLSVDQESIEMGECHHIRFTVRNTGSEPVTRRQLRVRLPSFVIGVYGANCDPVSNIEYRITPNRWGDTIAPSNELTFGVLLSSEMMDQPTAA